MKRSFSITQTVAAIVTLIIVYIIVVKFSWAISDHMGKREGDPGLLDMLGRSLFLSGLSALAAFFFSSWLFPNAHIRAVAISFAISIALLMFIWMSKDVPREMSLKAVFITVFAILTAIPPLLLAYILWKNNSWSLELS